MKTQLVSTSSVMRMDFTFQPTRIILTVNGDTDIKMSLAMAKAISQALGDVSNEGDLDTIRYTTKGELYNGHRLEMKEVTS